MQDIILSNRWCVAINLSKNAKQAEKKTVSKRMNLKIKDHGNKKKDKMNTVILNWLLFSILLICISVNLTWKWQSIPGGIVYWQLDWSVSST